MEQLQNQQPEEQLVLKDDAFTTRKQLATMFESFLVARMQQGQVEPNAAKGIAQQFVEIFQNATSVESQREAITLLEKDQNPVLHNFALRIQEMNEVQLRHNLYDFMLSIAKKGELANARSLYQLFDTGEIHDTASLQSIIKARQNSMGIKDAAMALKVALEQNKQTGAAAQLDQLIQLGKIQSQADLDQWQALVPGYVVQLPVSDTKSIIFAPQTAPMQSRKMNQLQRAWEGVHRLDQQIRHLIGLDN